MRKPDQVRLEILRLLCLEEEWIPASRLSAGRSRTAVSNHIAALKRLGYKIESSPARGYRLKSAPDAIHEIELRRVMGENPLAREIHSFDHTDSTSSQAARLADEGAPHGTLVIAEQQTRGRGRLGRSWASPPGTGLYFSLVLRPKIELHRAPQLTLLAATAVASAVERTANISPRIKWPNDLLLDGKKFCGILTELSGDPDRVRHVILGIGVNVGTKKFPKEIAPLATSLRLALGKDPPPRALLLAALLDELDERLLRFEKKGFASIRAEWEERSGIRGKKLLASAPGGKKIEGVALGLDEEGALILKVSGGRKERIIAGDVTLL